MLYISYPASTEDRDKWSEIGDRLLTSPISAGDIKRLGKYKIPAGKHRGMALEQCRLTYIKYLVNVRKARGGRGYINIDQETREHASAYLYGLAFHKYAEVFICDGCGEIAESKKQRECLCCGHNKVSRIRLIKE